jgi:hypothetical protein
LKEQNQFYPKVSDVSQNKDNSLDADYKPKESFKFNNKINGRNTLDF